MSGSAKISFVWGDGEHTFRLAIGQLRELQDKCGAGPMEILSRLTSGTWRVDDLRETIRLGLIGGGKTPTDALILVARYVDAFPLVNSVAPAQAVLMAALVGVENDPVGKPMAAKTKRKATGASSSRRSTAQEPPSASIPASSTT